MEYGFFDSAAKEYVINTYDTERPWINYLSNGRYTTLLSQTGGGYSFWKDPKSCRITKYRFDNQPQDRPGRYLYLRDQETGQYWANGWQPVLKNPEKWEARHGLGYSVIASQTDKIESSVTYFIPNDDDCEVWVTTIKNNDSRVRKLKVTPYVEFALFNAADEYTAYFNLRYFNDAKFEPDMNGLYYFMHFTWMDMGRVFMGLSEKITGYTLDRRHFIDKYRSEENPEAIETGKDHNTPVFGSDCCGAPSFEITLNPGEELKFSLVMGVDNNVEGRAKELISKYSNFTTCELELEKVRAKWNSLLSNFNITCPDTDINDMANVWNQYQAKVAFDWSRWASYYHTGTYRGLGFRDTSQDCLGTLHTFPELVREKIILLAKNMYEDGHAYHCFFFDGTGDATKYGDDHLWIINAVYNYLAETGDKSIIDEVVPYIEGSTGTIFEHMRRAVDYAFRESGPHGFPKMFFADWNDCLNNVCRKEKGEKGESVMVAMQLYQFGNQLIDIAKWVGKTDEVQDLVIKFEELRARINDIAWDGEWYTRAYTDDNNVLGSKTSEEGKIYLNTQSWAVFSGVADEKRATAAMDSVHSKLNSKVGIKLLDPPYTKFPQDVGSVIHYPGGIKENAGIFCHANTWAIIAECLLKRADKAMQYYTQILPPKVSKAIGHERYRVEPYVYCQFITGPDHPNHGAASHSWLTGTSVWSFVAISQYILGIRPTFDGLLIDPCVPKEWPEYEVRRVYRGATYNFKVTNPTNVTHGVKSITLNGKLIQATTLPIMPVGSVNTVEVVLGSAVVSDSKPEVIGQLSLSL